MQPGPAKGSSGQRLLCHVFGVGPVSQNAEGNPIGEAIEAVKCQLEGPRHGPRHRPAPRALFTVLRASERLREVNLVRVLPRHLSLFTTEAHKRLSPGHWSQGRHKIRTDGPARRYAAHGLVRALCAAGRRAENRGSLRRYRLVAPSRREPVRLEDAIRHKGVIREIDEDRPADRILGRGSSTQRSGASGGSRPPRLRLDLDGRVLRLGCADPAWPGWAREPRGCGSGRHSSSCRLGPRPPWPWPR